MYVLLITFSEFFKTHFNEFGISIFICKYKHVFTTFYCIYTKGNHFKIFLKIIFSLNMSVWIPCVLKIEGLYYTYCIYCTCCTTLIKKKTQFSSYIRKLGSGAKSKMRKGFLIYEEMRKFFPIHTWGGL